MSEGFASTTGPAGTRTVSANAAVTTSEPVLLPDGECSATVALSPTTRPIPSEIAPGVTECELVRLKGTKPIDVLVGESGKGQREDAGDVLWSRRARDLSLHRQPPDPHRQAGTRLIHRGAGAHRLLSHPTGEGGRSGPQALSISVLSSSHSSSAAARASASSARWRES